MAETGTQNITEVTEASSIATGDNIYLNHSNQLQQIDYDKLATAILNKLSTQSFSSLETTAKTVLGGINELNSKRLGNIVYYNADTNRNNIENRYAAMKYVFDTYGNKVDTYTVFVVRYSGGYYYNYILMRQNIGGSYTILEYSYYSNTGISIYTYNTSSGNISTNHTFSDDDTLFAGTEINSGDDLNDYTKPGRYYSPNASTTASLLNMPEIFESGFSMDVLPISSNNVQIIYPGGVGKNIYTRSAVSSGWQPWYKFAGTVISS